MGMRQRCSDMRQIFCEWASARNLDVAPGALVSRYPAGRGSHAQPEADMQEISTRQRLLFRVIVLAVIVMVLAMFGVLRHDAVVVY
jgi:hypothetical protein